MGVSPAALHATRSATLNQTRHNLESPPPAPLAPAAPHAALQPMGSCNPGLATRDGPGRDAGPPPCRQQQQQRR